MDAKEMLRKLEKLFNEHKLKRITQENEEFTASKGDKEYHGKRVINQLFGQWETNFSFRQRFSFPQDTSIFKSTNPKRIQNMFTVRDLF